MKLSDFNVLTFDCYGTLIDWETGIHEALRPLLARAAPGKSRDEALEAFARHESAQEAQTPAMLYPEILSNVYRRLAAEWGVPCTLAEANVFGASVPDWPAFDDSVEALQYLQQHFKLVVLSNVDRLSFRASNARLQVAFDAIYPAQDIGSYKPDPRNFDYLLQHLKSDLGLEASEVLHTAQSLFHDHAPANAAGLASAWIDRRHAEAGWGATMAPPGTPRYDFRFDSMIAMARAHQAERSGTAG